jgi:hypothetical protein
MPCSVKILYHVAEVHFGLNRTFLEYFYIVYKERSFGLVIYFRYKIVTGTILNFREKKAGGEGRVG